MWGGGTPAWTSPLVPCRNPHLILTQERVLHGVKLKSRNRRHISLMCSCSIKSIGKIGLKLESLVFLAVARQVNLNWGVHCSEKIAESVAWKVLQNNKDSIELRLPYFWSRCNPLAGLGKLKYLLNCSFSAVECESMVLSLLYYFWLSFFLNDCKICFPIFSFYVIYEKKHYY